jgi:hypothetical protein
LHWQGNKEYYVLMLPFLAWYASVDTCRRFAFVGFYAALLNNCVKDLLKLPRPPKRLQLIDHDGRWHTRHTWCTVAARQCLPFRLLHFVIGTVR